MAPRRSARAAARGTAPAPAAGRGGGGGRSRRRAAPAAAATAAHNDEDDGQLLLLLQLIAVHAPRVLQQRELCALLCTSAPVAASVAAHFRGCVALHARPRTLEQADGPSDWLVRHAALLASLRFEPRLPWVPGSGDWYSHVPPSMRKSKRSKSAPEPLEDNADAGRLLGWALGAAADANEGSLAQLEAFTCSTADVGLQQVLPALPVTLTRLEVAWMNFSSKWFGSKDWDDWDAPLAHELSRLTGLRSLTLHYQESDVWRYCHSLHNGLPCTTFSHLTQLTELVVTGPGLTESQRLPASLERLIVPGRGQYSYGPVELGHLTRLTELHCWRALKGFSLWQDDRALPVSIVRLHGRGHELSLLQQLLALRHLPDQAFTASQLQGVCAALPGLTSVGLLHHCTQPGTAQQAGAAAGGAGAAAGAAAGGAAAPGAAPANNDDSGVGQALAQLAAAGLTGVVHTVELRAGPSVFQCGTCAPAALARLTALQGLTALRIENATLSDEGLGHLSCLRDLRSLDVGLSKLSIVSARALPGLLAGLPCSKLALRSEHVEAMLLGGGGSLAAQLAGLSQLRSLHVPSYYSHRLADFVEDALERAGATDVAFCMHY